MIYKVEIGDCTIVEIEACASDKQINLHFQQGYEQNKGEVKFTSFLNSSLNESECLDLIKALQLSLTDFKKKKRINKKPLLY